MKTLAKGILREKMHCDSAVDDKNISSDFIEGLVDICVFRPIRKIAYISDLYEPDWNLQRQISSASYYFRACYFRAVVCYGWSGHRWRFPVMQAPQSALARCQAAFRFWRRCGSDLFLLQDIFVFTIDLTYKRSRITSILITSGHIFACLSFLSCSWLAPFSRFVLYRPAVRV